MNLHQPGSLLFFKEMELYENQLTFGSQSSLHYHKKLSLKKIMITPVALTSSVTKCLEKLIVWELKSQIQGQLESHQFAYKTIVALIMQFQHSFSNILKIPRPTLDC